MRPHFDDPRVIDRQAPGGVMLGWRVFALLLVLAGVAGIVYMQFHYVGRGARFAAWMTLGLGAMVWAGIVIHRDRQAGMRGD